MRAALVSGFIALRNVFVNRSGKRYDHKRDLASAESKTVQLATIHCFLVHASKRAEIQPQIGGAIVPKRGRLFDMLSEIFDGAETDCPIDIAFTHNSRGAAQNPCRNL